MPIIKLVTEIEAPKEIVFDFSRSIDLHKISTQHTKEEAIAGVTSGLIGANQTVTWRAKHFGLFHTLTSRITEFEMHEYFVDEMLDGIFKRFRHEHIFEKGSDGTIMKDVFDYTSPYGVLGRIADIVFLKRYMTELLEKRNRTIKMFAESDQWKSVLK